MKDIVKSTQFKKDIKKYSHDLKKMEDLRMLLLKLQNEEPIPPEYHPHQLKGKYKGCFECHIQSDFLLIWIEESIIELVRLGSHSELFK